jgi:hypothetical protein
MSNDDEIEQNGSLAARFFLNPELMHGKRQFDRVNAALA